MTQLMDAFADSSSHRLPTLADIHSLIRQGQIALAMDRCQQLLARQPEQVDGWLLLSQLAQKQSQFELMQEAAEQALSLQPNASAPLLRVIECHICNGNMQRALQLLSEQEARLLLAAGGADRQQHARQLATDMQQLAQLYSHCAAHTDANRCYRLACTVQPNNPSLLYNLAASQFAVGDVDGAESSLAHCLRHNPHDYDAHYLRCSLRSQTAADSNAKTIETLLQEPRHQREGGVALHYALGKCYEDQGEHGRAFAAYQRGASQRRQRLAYRVESDLGTLSAIAQQFSADRFRQRPTASKAAAVTPVFVIGLPRSGTTLVDRILCSHSQVDSLGEINDFAFAVLRGVGPNGGKRDLVQRSVLADHARIGDEYRRSTAGYGRHASVLVDKTPLNFLYLGLIQLALPEARIVHVRRHPLDSCFAMYKTLFRMGYPFSYDFSDLARYYAGYHALMQHWQQVLPAPVYHLDYEALVQDQETQSRQLLQACGLEWQPACLDFHRNQRPAATASATQVRQPIPQRSVQQWRHYGSALQPLAEALLGQGIALPGYPE